MMMIFFKKFRLADCQIVGKGPEEDLKGKPREATNYILDVQGWWRKSEKDSQPLIHPAILNKINNKMNKMRQCLLSIIMLILVKHTHVLSFLLY